MYLLARIAQRLRFRDRRDEIALVDDRNAQRGQALAEPRDPECRRSHIDAAAIAPEVERHADDVDGTARIKTVPHAPDG